MKTNDVIDKYHIFMVASFAIGFASASYISHLKNKDRTQEVKNLVPVQSLNFRTTDSKSYTIQKIGRDEPACTMWRSGTGISVSCKFFDEVAKWPTN